MFLIIICVTGIALAQDAATGALRGTVEDAAGARVAGAQIIITQLGTGWAREIVTDEQGTFTASMLPPGEYLVRVTAQGWAGLEQAARVEVGGTLLLTMRLRLERAQETVLVTEPPGMVATETAAVSTVLLEEEISELPLNGRRFSDLALLTPNTTPDPRSLTSAT
ncbi:MAG: carboxypeptidase-like regulatory domain-containing protein [Terriglobales bacterium]